MTRFVVGEDRSQSTMFPERLDDYLGEDNPVRAVDVFVDELDPIAGTIAARKLWPASKPASPFICRNR